MDSSISTEDTLRHSPRGQAPEHEENLTKAKRRGRKGRKERREELNSVATADEYLSKLFE